MRITVKPYIHPDAVFENARIGRNVHVIADAEVRNATLERTVVFPGAKISNSTIHRSIIDEHAHVAGIELGDVLVDAYAQLVTEVKSAERDGGLPGTVDSRR